MKKKLIYGFLMITVISIISFPFFFEEGTFYEKYRPGSLNTLRIFRVNESNGIFRVKGYWNKENSDLMICFKPDWGKVQSWSLPQKVDMI